MRKIRKNDQVVVIAGKFKGQTGSVLEINWDKNTVVVDKINVVKKHVKPSQQNPDGGIQEFEAPIAVSNVALKDSKNNPIKVGFKVEDGKKVRIDKKTGKAV